MCFALSKANYLRKQVNLFIHSEGATLFVEQISPNKSYSFKHDPHINKWIVVARLMFSRPVGMPTSWLGLVIVIFKPMELLEI